MRSCGGRLPAFDWAAAVLADLDRFHALVIGPGLGRERRHVAVGASWSSPPPCRSSSTATGCSRWRGTPTAHAPILRRRTSPTVLTPHDGEYALLAGHRPAPTGSRRPAGWPPTPAHVVLLKGPATVVAAPDGEVLSWPTATQRLATAGTGDVLAGHHRCPAGRAGSIRSDAAGAGGVAARRGRVARPGAAGSSPATCSTPPRGARALS